MKSAEAFRTISEVSELLDTPAHVLRFWESRFTQIKPIKRAGGRRYYRPGDVALLAGIKQLLHDDGLTIRGVQKILRERGVAHVASLSPVDVMAAIGAMAAVDRSSGPKLASRDERPDARTADEDLPLGTTGIMAFKEGTDDDDADSHSPFVDDTAALAAPASPLWPAAETPDIPNAAPQLLPDPSGDEAPMIVDVPVLPRQGYGMVTAIGRVQGREPEPAAAIPDPLVPGVQAPQGLAPATLTPETGGATGESEAISRADADNSAGHADEGGAGHRPDTGLIDETPLPAARMLRAMTAVRARDHRAELTAIYERARKLHVRLSDRSEVIGPAD